MRKPYEMQAEAIEIIIAATEGELCKLPFADNALAHYLGEELKLLQEKRRLLGQNYPTLGVK